jgi:hypothetical protein
MSSSIARSSGISTVVSAGGPIVSLIKGGFTIAAGVPVGSIHIFTGGATLGGGAVKVGSFAEATGSGSLATSIDATYVAIFPAAPPPVTLTGTVVAATAYGFALNAGTSYSRVPVVLNGLTVVGGGSLNPGAGVRVSGLGSESAGVLAVRVAVSATPSPGSSATPSPAPIAMKHVLTMDYLGGLNGSHAVRWSATAPYLTWAETGVADANAIHAAGIATIFYIDANRTEAGDALHTSDESTYAHACNGARVTDTYQNATQYVMDPESPSMRALFATYVARIAAEAHFDAIFEDDAGALSAFAPYTPFSAMPCHYTNAGWIAGGVKLDRAPPLPVTFNGLSGLNRHGVSLSTHLLGGANVLGGIYEGCYTASDQPKMRGWLWSTIENTELYSAHRAKSFVCLGIDEAAASAQTDARLYAYASFLLTYDPAHDIFWDNAATPSGFHVLPESGLVALDPKVAEPATVASLRLTGGAYGREYAQCYIRGSFVGACAVAVNPSSSAVPFPFVTYRHGLVLSGSGVLDGGAMATTGVAPNTLAADEAAIVFP